MLLFFLSAVMSGLGIRRYENSNLDCNSRGDGDEDPNIIRIKRDSICISYCVRPLPVSLSQPTCVLPQVTGKNVSEYAKTRLGQMNLWAHMFFFREMCYETESHFLLPLFTQASAVIDRYRELCCWYMSIATSLFLCTLHTSLRRPYLSTSHDKGSCKCAWDAGWPRYDVTMVIHTVISSLALFVYGHNPLLTHFIIVQRRAAASGNVPRVDIYSWPCRRGESNSREIDSFFDISLECFSLRWFMITLLPNPSL
jgi:hypothetical protein